MTYKVSQVGVPVQEMIDTLNKLLTVNDDNVIKTQIENLRSRVQSPEQSDRLGKILGALNVPNGFGNGAHVVDPISGEPYPNTQNFIKEYISELQGHKKMSSTFNLEKYSQEKKKNKDSRGNPFRVLMGKIGKLLDHGLEKRDIVRYLLKEKIWNESTIEKAIKIVKDYNKKKHRKNKKVEAAGTFLDEANSLEKGTPDYSKRSSGELITSICWLSSLASFDAKNSFETREVDDRSGVKTMIRQIKSELLKRGMSEDELNKLIK